MQHNSLLLCALYYSVLPSFIIWLLLIIIIDLLFDWLIFLHIKKLTGRYIIGFFGW